MLRGVRGRQGAGRQGQEQMENPRENPKSLLRARGGWRCRIGELSPSPVRCLWGKGRFSPSSGGRSQPAAPAAFAVSRA